MKKITFLAAAIAMLAFASCNKEENQVSLTFGQETADAKQALDYYSILFTDGENIFVNGQPGQLQAINGRKWGKLDVPSSPTGYKVNYGVASVDAEGVAHATYAQNMNMIYNYEGAVEINVANHNPFPMSAFASDATVKFKLKHNMAFVSPMVKYGYKFAEYLWGADGKDVVNNQPLQFAENATANDVPEIRITRLEITSENGVLDNEQYYAAKLWGPMHIEENNDGDEVMVFDNNTLPADNRIIVNTTANGVAPFFNWTPQNLASNGLGLGVFPMVPMDKAHRHYTATFFFEATVNGVVRHYSYTGSWITSGSAKFLRHEVFAIRVNWFNLDTTAWDSRLTVLD